MAMDYASFAWEPADVNSCTQQVASRSPGEELRENRHILLVSACTLKMADCMYGRATEGVLDLCNGAVSEKTSQNFSPSPLAEYVTAFSGRTVALEVRCDLTDTHTHDDYTVNPRCACAPRVNNTVVAGYSSGKY